MKQFFLHRHFSAPLSATSVELLNAGPETLNMLLALRSQAAVTDREDRLTMEDGVNRRDFWGVSSQTRISSALDTDLSPCHELPQRSVSPSPPSPARVGNEATIRTRHTVHQQFICGRWRFRVFRGSSMPEVVRRAAEQRTSTLHTMLP